MCIRKLAMIVIVITGIVQTLAGQAGPAPTPEAMRLFQAAEELINGQEIIAGSCWDFINAVFIRAGFPAAAREQIYLTKENGPYASLTMVQPGDWLYIKLNGIGHSVLFVKWAPKALAQGGDADAIFYEYQGHFIPTPGRRNCNDVSRIYGIIRVKPEKAWIPLPQ